MDCEVTIGIPLYNAAGFIRRTLESALAQTFDSIEVLVVDDCGTDGSADIVREMQTGHPRGGIIRIVRQPENMGVGPARNRIIDEARGRYLYFMDSDDLIVPETISLLYNNVLRHDAEIAFGSYLKAGTDGACSIREEFVYPELVLAGPDALASFAFRKYGGIQAAVWNYLVRLDFLRGTGLRFINANYWEDMVFTYALTTYVSRAVLLPAVTYHYICRDNSLSNYQRRRLIEKSEVLRNVNTIDWLKGQTPRLAGKPYLGNWCANIMMTDFYIVCNALKNRALISPAMTPADYKAVMCHPLTLRAILALRCSRLKNILLYALGRLPASLSVWIIRQMGRRKGLV
ncbi:MAG: glycosyltransferase family 2 protein [Prevotella sp.]|nr:glycosyltransferase family 2 protein [Prevotella sp.]